MKRNKKKIVHKINTNAHTSNMYHSYWKQNLTRTCAIQHLCIHSQRIQFFFSERVFCFFFVAVLWVKEERKKYHKKRSHVLDFTCTISTVFEIWNDIMARPKKLLNEQKKRARDVHQIKHLCHVQLCVCVAANNTIIDNWCCCWCAATSASIDQNTLMTKAKMEHSQPPVFWKKRRTTSGKVHGS